LVPPVSPLPLGEGPGVRENTAEFMLQYLNLAGRRAPTRFNTEVITSLNEA